MEEAVRAPLSGPIGEDGALGQGCTETSRWRIFWRNSWENVDKRAGYIKLLRHFREGDACSEWRGRRGFLKTGTSAAHLAP